MSETPDANLRLHPSTLAIRFLGRLPELVFGLPAAAYFLGNIDLRIAFAIAAVGLVLSMLYSWVYWMRFGYGLSDEQLVIESGIFSRNRRTIPFDRIQDVSLEQSLLARIFGVSIVRIETGSSGSDEGKLQCVSRAEADRLRDTIRRHKAGAVSAETHEAEAEITVEAPVLFSMGPGRLLMAGLFGFSLVFLAIIGAAFQYFGSAFTDTFIDVDQWVGEDGEKLLALASLYSVLMLIGGLFVIGMITGVIRTFVREYGFVLSRTESGLRRERGLFTRTDVVIPLKRIQAAIVSTGIIRKLFGWQELSLQSLGGDLGGSTHHVAAPFAQRPEIMPILDEVALPAPPERSQFRSVSKNLIFRSWLEDIPLVLLIALIVGQFWGYVLWFLIPLLPVLIFQPVLQYLTHGFHGDEDILFVRNRFFSPGTTIVAHDKIQSVTFRQALTQKWFGTATLVIGMAGGKVTSPLRIIDLPESEARALMERLLVAPRQAAFDI